MKNFDKYMQDILIESNEQYYQVTCWWRYKYLGKRIDTECSCDDCTECQKQFFEWLNEEYKEPIKITEDEKVILRNLPKKFKWIVRFEDFNIPMLSEDKPYKRKNNWFNKNGFTTLDPFGHLFKFIKYDDEEPYSIEELLKEE